MKIQGLAVLAIVIILPMAIILNSYSSNQIKTLDLQISYDSKLKSATYDGIKAFQLNMSNSTTSNLANSKMRDIKASLKTFYNSLASQFNMSGYGEEVLQNYVPAVVYTLYDGYYIYSAYDNKLDEADTSLLYDEASYKDGDEIYGLKPYIYYSCRYKRGTDDFVITYSLDSYITIQGIVNGQPVNDSGYLLTGVTKSGNPGFYTTGDKYYYKGVEIIEENNKDGLRKQVYMPDETPSSSQDTIITLSYQDSNGINRAQLAGSLKWYSYKKINGVKYYKEGNKVFAMINDEKIIQNGIDSDTITQNSNGIKYYKDAYEFKDRILNTYRLGDLRTSDAVDSNGNRYTVSNNPYPIERDIFAELDDTSGKYIEDSNSEFNAHKTEVIKNSIETNLMVAISNYNNVSTSDVNFAMPKLQDYEWETITQNISMITFLQGLSIGGKVYNGYAVVQNNVNEDFVSEDSIYILYHGTYYRVTDLELLTTISNWNDAIGLLNTDFERRTALASYENTSLGLDLKKNVYYYPRADMASYNSIINLNKTENQTISEYLNDAKDSGITSSKYKLAQRYYTALGRERYGLYRVQNKLEEVQEDLMNPTP